MEFTTRSKAKSVGIIGTKNTILSNVYAKKIQSINNTITSHSLATPLLVPMIEEGFYQNKISQTILATYLERKELKAIDHLILGCTHYPLIEEEIKQYYKGTVDVINSARIVSKHVKNALMNVNLLNNESHTTAKHQFHLSDYTSSFEQSAQHFFGEKISLVETDID